MKKSIHYLLVLFAVSVNCSNVHSNSDDQGYVELSWLVQATAQEEVHVQEIETELVKIQAMSKHYQRIRQYLLVIKKIVSHKNLSKDTKIKLFELVEETIRQTIAQSHDPALIESAEQLESDLIINEQALEVEIIPEEQNRDEGVKSNEYDAMLNSLASIKDGFIVNDEPAPLPLKTIFSVSAGIALVAGLILPTVFFMGKRSQALRAVKMSEDYAAVRGKLQPSET